MSERIQDPHFNVPPKPDDQLVVVGDSLGVGIQGHTRGGAGDTWQGRNPTEGLQAIKAHPEYYNGKTAVVSSGLSNDPSQLDVVAKQIQALKAAGAIKIILMGVGGGRTSNGTPLAPLNEDLRKIAAANGADFLNVQPHAPTSVHPDGAGYRQLAADAQHIADCGGITPAASLEPQASAGGTTPGTGPSARAGARPPARSTLDGGAVAPQQAHDAFQQALKAQTPEGEKLRRALDDIKKTGGTQEEKEVVQQALKKAGYNLGGYGANHDGIDGILGPLTSAALRAATDDNGFVDQLTPEWRRTHPGHGHASRRHAHTGQRHTGHAEHTPHSGGAQHSPRQVGLRGGV